MKCSFSLEYFGQPARSRTAVCKTWPSHQGRAQGARRGRAPNLGALRVPSETLLAACAFGVMFCSRLGGSEQVSEVSDGRRLDVLVPQPGCECRLSHVLISIESHLKSPSEVGRESWAAAVVLSPY